MATKGKRPMRALTAGDKIEAIQRVNDGESKASVARDIGVPESTLRGWCKNEDKLRYMSSRRSTPEAERSDEPPDKRARLSPAQASPSPPAATLDLSAAAIPPPAPLELTSKPTPPRPAPDTGASVSMSAISPLSGLAHLPPLAHSHLGLSFNDIANLSLIAQLNPSLTGLTGTSSASSSARALRSVRSPKPAQHLPASDTALNLSEKHRNGKSHHESHRESHRSKHHSSKEPMDEALWYWLKTQQAMLDLTAATQAQPLTRSPKENRTHSPKPVVPTAPINPHVDYNRNTWFWQYYKQFGGALPPPDDKLRSASLVPKEKNENILYSHLTKNLAKTQDTAKCDPIEVKKPAPPATSPNTGKEPIQEKPDVKSQSKARIVLDNLLFNNNNSETSDREASNAIGEAGEDEAAAALQHGERFLRWLEACGDPSVTRVQVHQLRALLHNLRARRLPPSAPTPPAPAAASPAH